MVFKNYCVVIMGDTNGVQSEIEKVSEDKPNILDAKGIVIATFSSSLKTSELSEWFRLNGRSYFVFDLDPDSSGYHITKKEIHDGLFSFIEKSKEDILKKRASDLMSAIEDAKIIQENSRKHKNKGIDVKTVVRPKRLTENEIESMTRKEKDDCINKIIDKGVEKMTEYDKQILSLLAK